MPKISELQSTTVSNDTDVLALYDPNVTPTSRQIEVQNVAVQSSSSVGKLHGGAASSVVLAEEVSDVPPAAPTIITGYASKTGGASVDQSAGTIIVPNTANYKVSASILMKRIAGVNNAEVFLELWVNSVREQMQTYRQPAFSTYLFIPVNFSVVRALTANDSLSLRVYTTDAFTAHTVDFTDAFFEVETFYG